MCVVISVKLIICVLPLPRTEPKHKQTSAEIDCEQCFDIFSVILSDSNCVLEMDSIDLTLTCFPESLNLLHRNCRLTETTRVTSGVL